MTGIQFYQHPATGKKMVTALVFADLGEVPLQAVADAMVELLGNPVIAKNYAEAFVKPLPDIEWSMTLDGLRVLQGHLEPQYPGTGRNLAMLRVALGGE